MNDINFTRELTKGKITELIFAQMVRNTKAYTVLQFGYETTLPELAHLHPKSPSSEKTVEIIKHAPDFTIINHDDNSVHLVEVKYRHALQKSDILRQAKALKKSWASAALFIATPDGFYFDSVEDIIKNKGEIAAFKHPKIKAKAQQQYLDLLNEFIS